MQSLRVRSLLGLVGACSLGLTAIAQVPDLGWAYNGGLAQDHFSPLAQITPANVAALKQVWTFPLEEGNLESQPIVVGRTLYAITPGARLVALDAASGAQKWVFDAKVPGGQPVRGLASWSDGKTSRLVFSDQNLLFLIDPATGKPDPRFGSGGHIDLREGLRGKPEDNVFFVTSPAVVYKNLIIVGGGRVAETLPASPSPARAYDARTGKLVWTFHTIPHPGEVGAETWPKDAYLTQGGANAWAGTTIDAGRGIVFINTGSASEDLYGALRLGSNRFASSLIALDAATGKRLWDFQLVHHDLWDSDSTSAPVLATVTKGGRKIDVVITTNKQSHIWAFERTTGKPLFPIRETPVPPSTVPGEKAWPTQPVPVLPHPLSRTNITEKDLIDSPPDAAARARRAFAALNPGSHYVPLMVDKDTLVAPGFAGGNGIGGYAADRKGFIYAHALNGTSVSSLTEFAKLRAAAVGENAYLTNCAVCHGRERTGDPPDIPSLAAVRDRLSNTQIADVVHIGRGRMPAFPTIPEQTLNNLVSYLTTGADLPGTEPPPVRQPGVGEGAGANSKYVFTGYRRFTDASGQSLLKGPAATLNAVDMNTGAYAWTIPFTPGGGGPIVTGGGLLFIPSGDKLQAYDPRNGKRLWEAQLPGANGRTPITYRVGGKQYVVIAAGAARGRAAAATPATPGAYLAFALPD